MCSLCIFKDYMDHRRKKKNRRDGESISEDYSSQQTTEGTHMSNIKLECSGGLETVPPCPCIKPRQQRSHSCPSCFSPKRPRPIPPRTRSESVTPWDGQDSSLFEIKSLVIDEPETVDKSPDSESETYLPPDRCRDRLSRTRERRRQREVEAFPSEQTCSYKPTKQTGEEASVESVEDDKGGPAKDADSLCEDADHPIKIFVTGPSYSSLISPPDSPPPPPPPPSPSPSSNGTRRPCNVHINYLCVPPRTSRSSSRRHRVNLEPISPPRSQQRRPPFSEPPRQVPGKLPTILEFPNRSLPSIPEGSVQININRFALVSYFQNSTLSLPSIPEGPGGDRSPHITRESLRSLNRQLFPPTTSNGLLRNQLRRSTTVSSRMPLMNEDAVYRDRKIVLEFTHLLEKSKQLFTGLRALPQHGHKHWQFYFSRTFDVYTKLWKYQQQHRALLNEEYGLRRWQIGEIASKIGQLYYHFYLRTSEVTYLFDAYEFYAAIRGRGYYAKAADESNGDLMIKRLRYYTRFIVVSLLTRKLKFVEELISELDDVIMEYGDSYDPEDQIQWTMVSSEVKAFLAVECAIIIEDPECKKSLRTKTRLTSVSIPCIDKTPQMNLRLQKAVIIGSGSYQARVSELTIDMYRILQTIEREPVQSREVWEEPRNPFADGLDRGFNIEIATANAPEKNLLFKPSPTQALVYIASACEDLSPIGALLLYISADGVTPNTKGGEDYGFETGGLITTSKSDIYGEVRASTPARYKEIQCLHPGDLQPFTRKPLFLIVDSDHSTIFLKMRRPFEMPMVILMSPTEFPPSLKEYENMGGLLTLFLYCPLGAVCRICSVDNVTADMWVEAQILINNFLQEATVVAIRVPLDPSYICFMGDDFLRVQIARYIFCELVLRMHRGFVSRNHLPRASPPLPEQLFDNIALTEMVLDLATFLKIRNQFFNPFGAGGPSSD